MACGWLQEGESNISPPENGHPGDICQIMSFLIYVLLPSSVFYKTHWDPDPDRWFLQDISLLSSQSAGFPSKVIFLASAPRL